MTDSPLPTTPTGGEPKTRWLIEETWSGFVHYVHRDFNCEKWAAEAARDRSRNAMGMASLMRVPLVTKNINDAMMFPSRGDAEVWLTFQPHWMIQGDQYQIREHEWVGPQVIASASTGGEPTAGHTADELPDYWKQKASAINAKGFSEWNLGEAYVFGLCADDLRAAIASAPTLAARNAELEGMLAVAREALRPFATLYLDWIKDHEIGVRSMVNDGQARGVIGSSDFRRAAEALGDD